MTRKEASDLIKAIDARDFLHQKKDAVIQIVSENPDMVYTVRTSVLNIPVEFSVTGGFIISKLINLVDLANNEVMKKGGLSDGY